MRTIFLIIIDLVQRAKAKTRAAEVQSSRLSELVFTVLSQACVDIPDVGNTASGA